MADLNQILNSLQSQINGVAGAARQAVTAAGNAASIAESVRQEHLKTQQVLAAVQGAGEGAGRADLRRIEAIPGRRIPFDVCVLIPVGATETNPQPVTYTVSQDGPFVAVRRFATFLSAFQFQATSALGAVQTFNGRSYGRYRPVSSVLDFMDGQNGWVSPIGAASPGTGLFSLMSTSQQSGFRSMEFDGTVEIESGSGYKRQSGPVPSAIWAPGSGFAQELAVLDMFERGDVIQFTAKPNHVNNPAAGNVQTLVGALPYLASQYDGHEGIQYPSAVPSASTADSITRQPDGILILGFHGFKILAAATMP